MTCNQTITPVFFSQQSGGDCVRCDSFSVADPPQITKHWDLSTCTLARSLDCRILVFNRSFNYATFSCCNLAVPLGWGDDYILVDYLPVISHRKAEQFSKFRQYQVTAAAVPKLDIAVYQSKFSALVVDVRSDLVLFTGEISEIDSYAFGQLKLIIDSSKPCGANYQDFLEALTRPDKPKPLAVMQQSPRNIEQNQPRPMEGNAFVRVL